MARSFFLLLIRPVIDGVFYSHDWRLLTKKFKDQKYEVWEVESRCLFYHLADIFVISGNIYYISFASSVSRFSFHSSLQMIFFLIWKNDRKFLFYQKLFMKESKKTLRLSIESKESDFGSMLTNWIEKHSGFFRFKFIFRLNFKWEKFI